MIFTKFLGLYQFNNLSKLSAQNQILYGYCAFAKCQILAFLTRSKRSIHFAYYEFEIRILCENRFAHTFKKIVQVHNGCAQVLVTLIFDKRDLCRNDLLFAVVAQRTSLEAIKRRSLPYPHLNFISFITYRQKFSLKAFVHAFRNDIKYTLYSIFK